MDKTWHKERRKEMRNTLLKYLITTRIQRLCSMNHGQKTTLRKFYEPMKTISRKPAL